MEKIIQDIFRFLYGKEKGASVAVDAFRILEKYKGKLKPPAGYKSEEFPLTEKDSFCITYGDSILREGEIPLKTLDGFFTARLKDTLSGIHILPFFPFTSDDGFSISDYRAVNPSLGGWEDVRSLGGSFLLMADLVLNHCSVKSFWFKEFLAGNPKYRDYFITADKDTDLSGVVRPRTLPLLTPFETKEGIRHVWTTFSADQVDLNFSHPPVLLEMLEILFFYISQGVSVIRLDAIAYLWKEIGHSCIHHEKTHRVVKLFRAFIELFAPWVILITETNVPHEQNISYFGKGDDEAHMVYQFPLPPLVLDAFVRSDCNHLVRWALSLNKPEGPNTYFNFLASHDGIGVTPAQGFLSQAEMDNLLSVVKERGGFVSYKSTPSGNIPYELNINYLDALSPKTLPEDLRAAQFLAAQAVLLSMPGVPGIYIHSLLGSGNWQEGVALTGRNRSINRERINLAELERDLGDPESLRSRIFCGFIKLLKARASSRAFEPLGKSSVMPSAGKVFPILRQDREGREKILCLINVTGEEQRYTFNPGSFSSRTGDSFYDLVTNSEWSCLTSGLNRTAVLAPYQILWLVL